MQRSKWINRSRLRFIAGSVILMGMLTVAAQAQTQTHQPARIRVAMRGLEDRQLLPVLREIAAEAPNAYVTRIDLMIAAYTLVNFIESGDEKLEGRLAAVNAAFGTYADTDAAMSKPTEGAFAALVKRQFDLAWKELPERPELVELRERTAALERRVQELEGRLGRGRAGESRPVGNGGSGSRLMIVGGVAAALGMVFLVAR